MAALEQAIRTRNIRKVKNRRILTAVAECVVKERRRLPTLFWNVKN